MTNLQSSGSERAKRERVYYKSVELIGYENKSNGLQYTPVMMLSIFDKYELLINEERYSEAEDIEKCNEFPYQWLNFVISKTIKNSKNGIAEKLVERFRCRGYSNSWLGINKA
jgi:hypothetical protein